MKHLVVRQKYSAAGRIFNSLLGVSSGVILCLMLDILPHTLYNRLNASRLPRFQKTREHVNQGKRNPLFVVSNAIFTKTAIKPKFVDRFSLKNVNAAISEFRVH